MDCFKKIDDIGLMILNKLINVPIRQIYINGNVSFDSTNDSYSIRNGNIIFDRNEHEDAIKNVFRYSEITRDKNFRKIEMSDIAKYNNRINKNENILINPINDYYNEFFWQDGGLSYLQVKEVDLSKYIHQEYQFSIKKQLQITKISVYGLDCNLAEDKVTTDSILILESDSDRVLIQSIATEQFDSELILTFNKNQVEQTLSQQYHNTNDFVYKKQFELNG